MDGAAAPASRLVPAKATVSATHLVLMPSYNTGARILETVADVLRVHRPVWVVVDGSTDGSGAALAARVANEPGCMVIQRPRNGGKGAAVLDGLRAAHAAGFSHALVMDADGQHPAAMVAAFLRLSRRNPAAMILGVPVFDRTAPRARVWGRRVCNALTALETGGAIGDSLFGFRVYPVAPLLAVMSGTRWMRGFDFDAEAAVRLSWRGVPAINQAAPVRYLRAADGGVSHFRYIRDNVLLAVMHARLLARRWVRSFRR